MLKKITFVLLFVFVLGTSSAPQAQAVDMSEAIARMNSIIAEMEKLRAEFQTLASAVGQTTPAPAVLGAQSTNIFTQSLSYGDTNSDIKRIQQLLATDPEIYPYGVASGFFGPKTQEGIRNFQARFGLDTVGVVGPATKALLELFIAAYPDGNYPDGVLKKKPQVLGASTSNTPTAVTAPTVVSGGPAKKIEVTFDGDESLIAIEYTNGNRKGLIAPTVEKNAVVSYIASRTTLTQAQIEAVVTYSKVKNSSSSSDIDDGDAEDAMDDAEDAIDDAFDAIEEADDDGDDVDWAEDTLDEAEDLLSEAEDAYDDEDYDEAVDLANEAEKMAKKAESRIDKEEGSEQGDSDEIESIVAEVDEDETEVTVEYEDGNEYVFIVEEDDEDDIIEEIADELDIDEDDVEDFIEFEYGKIKSIEVDIRLNKNDSIVTVIYKSGVERRIVLDETDEDDIIEELADLLDEDEDDIEDWVDFL